MGADRYQTLHVGHCLNCHPKAQKPSTVVTTALVGERHDQITLATINHLVPQTGTYTCTYLLYPMECVKRFALCCTVCVNWCCTGTAHDVQRPKAFNATSNIVTTQKQRTRQPQDPYQPGKAHGKRIQTNTTLFSKHVLLHTEVRCFLSIGAASPQRASTKSIDALCPVKLLPHQTRPGYITNIFPVLFFTVTDRFLPFYDRLSVSGFAGRA